MKFKIGDIVRCYNYAPPILLGIEKIHQNEYLQFTNGDCAHPKTCRKLVKKKHREWWVNVYADGQATMHPSKQNAEKWGISPQMKECILVREVKEKK